jgi:hypothetical protein
VHANTTGKWWTSMERVLHCLLIVLLLLSCAGCASGPVKNLSLPFGRSSDDKALRKQVEADSFPTAKQAGLHQAAALR